MLKMKIYRTILQSNQIVANLQNKLEIAAKLHQCVVNKYLLTQIHDLWFIYFVDTILTILPFLVGKNSAMWLGFHDFCTLLMRFLMGFDQLRFKNKLQNL